MVEHYYSIAVSILGVDPLNFGRYTQKDIESMLVFKHNNWREKMEYKAWELSHALAPYSKNKLNAKDFFDYEKVLEKQNKTEEDEEKEIEMMFASEEEIKAINKSAIQKALEQVNINKAMKANGNN